MSSYVVGLTGGIGSGKTQVSNQFEKLGISVVDADIVARQVVEPGTACLAAIIQYFGNNIVDNEGQLNRPMLREIIFSDSDKKDWLNNLMHPAIRNEIYQQIESSNSPYCLLVAPLLLENGLDKVVNRVLVVDVEESVQLERTVARDKVSIEQVKNIIASQISREQRLARADDIIINNKSLSELEIQVTKLHHKYLNISQGQ